MKMRSLLEGMTPAKFNGKEAHFAIKAAQRVLSSAMGHFLGNKREVVMGYGNVTAALVFLSQALDELSQVLPEAKVAMAKLDEAMRAMDKVAKALEASELQVAESVHGWDDGIMEAKEVRLSMQDQVDQNLKAKGGSVKLTPAFYDWFVRKFSGKSHFSVTNKADAMSGQKISLNRPDGRTGTSTYTATPMGDYIKVSLSGGPGAGSTKFYTVESTSGPVAEDTARNNEILKDLLDRDTRMGIQKMTDRQAQSLAGEIVQALSDRMNKVMDDRFWEAVNRLRTAARQPSDDSARNLIFKAAHALGIKLPSMMF